MKYLKQLLLLTIGTGILILTALVAFAQDEHEMEMNPALIEHGREVFLVNGCTACHGQDAEGTDIAPALAGHTEFQVRRQVRSPAGIMLVFSPAQIPEEDLAGLVAYIHSLEPVEGEAGHDMSGITAGDIIFGHHWLLWLELEAGDVEGSIHHTAHIIELTEGTHLAVMQPVLTALGEADVDAAKAIVEPMVTGVGEFSHDIYTIGLQLTYLALTASDQEVAQHFAVDLSEHELSDEQMNSVSEVLEHIEACDLAGASSMIEMELGDDVNFIPEGMGMEMEEEEPSDMEMATEEEPSEEMDMGDGEPSEEMDMSGDEHSDMEMATEEAHSEEMDMSGDEHSEESSACGEVSQDEHSGD